jgi:hypothetical protein
MTGRASFTQDEARHVGEQIGIDWEKAPFDVEQFRIGMDVELEHGLHDLATNVTGDDPVVTGKIALAHLNEFPDYYNPARPHGSRSDLAREPVDLLGMKHAGDHARAGGVVRTVDRPHERFGNANCFVGHSFRARQVGVAAEMCR